jgi:hypothetical protein
MIKLYDDLQLKYDALRNVLIDSIEEKIGDKEFILTDEFIVVNTEYGNEDVMKINGYGVITKENSIVKFSHLNAQELLIILNYLEENE